MSCQHFDFLNWLFQRFDFKSIRVNSPLILVVNGKKFGLDKQAPSVLAVSAVSQWERLLLLWEQEVL